MTKKFRIRICSDLDYEEMVADICYEDNTVAMVTQEKGIDNMEIEFLSSEEITLPLDEFIEAISSAKKRLIDMQKLPE